MSYPTPSISHLKSEDYQLIYEPAEDSFLLLDALEKDAQYLKERSPSLCVEVGSGSGVVITFLASILGSCCSYIATDINTKATECTKQTASANGYLVDAIATNLVDCLLPRLHGHVDVLIFNPPYVVTPSEEVGSQGIEASWAGGEKGREVTDKLLPLVPLLLSDNGCFYIVTIPENKPEEIKDILCNTGGLNCDTIIQRKAGRERLSILRFSH
ncbi:methyltransferase N6AMT1 [Exaiptasia diaphana]|uniref:Methyltransferase HEMK2 n=1 Tax=Exaiptasia diaphana TaxID=2652724 RepID=A0A913XDG0_EXADI|nr:methyltransferase N6AMT1 [Exaiptasia diaphana]KXJ12877.1 HemK methyltransferase family member 2 [Exaiptasia diaphana]